MPASSNVVSIRDNSHCQTRRPVFHVEEMIVESLEAGCVRLVVLRTIMKKTQRRQRQRGRCFARHPAVFDSNRITGQGEAHDGDAAWRPIARCVGDKSVFGVDVFLDIRKSAALQAVY
jgi:hypothetical protein